MSLSIKKCNLNDLDQLTEIAIETFIDTFLPNNRQRDIDQYVMNAFNSSKITDEMHNPNSAFYFVFKDNELAGYLKINFDNAQTESMGSEYMEVQRIYVREKFKGMGVGTAMMERAIKLARHNKKEMIWLGVWEKNINAQKFYTKWGFKKTGTHVFLMGSTPNNDWIMTKVLV
ncbi:GNAT family N-acetyltransferase [Lentilactobacillus sp. SPB1-3]|uniref:GNAT family N-acetyltransferase n=1 Tax=Lentilactobacillus terminaliae TaxID=3003483 RepID=A0ACD5DDG2_9LACO|nr:GNAT family N-acetyltransferase [Lentilactobacillus sp. SPB1-3]MCZ0977957.1 GNAT family N-acetyltransferase [Lentilactobacillus sp. SPB1-3]